MMSAGADYSLKICIMNASSHSPPNKGERKQCQTEEGFPAECTREMLPSYNCQVFLWQGLKGTGQS